MEAELLATLIWWTTHTGLCVLSRDSSDATRDSHKCDTKS